MSIEKVPFWHYFYIIAVPFWHRYALSKVPLYCIISDLC